jgi:hypothetical protein
VEFRSASGLLRVVKAPTFPSLVTRDGRSKKALAGWAALDEIENAKKKRAPLRHGHDFFRSVKSDIGSRLTYPWSFSEELRRPAQVLGLLIREILSEAARTDLRGVDLLRQAVTIPYRTDWRRSCAWKARSSRWARRGPRSTATRPAKASPRSSSAESFTR